MSKSYRSNLRVRVLCAGIAMGVTALGFALRASMGDAAQASTASARIPNFAPDDHTSWYPDRLDGDNWLPAEGGGPGPILSRPDHPYVPNDASDEPTYRIADLSNPILQPWVREQMKRDNDEVLAGKIPFMARERCYPPGMAWNVFRRVTPPMVFFVQQPTFVLLMYRGDNQFRHVYLNVPHSAHVKPSWYGESVGYYDGDELVVDTIGLNDRTFVDNYRTPHTEQLHVVERFKMVDGGKTLQVFITVDDPGAFNMPWSAIQRWRRINRGPLIEDVCEPNVERYFGYDVAPIPRADKPDF